MKRRDFITASLASAAALAATRVTGEARAAALPQAPAPPGPRRFRLHYAPSLGQFKAHAGTDLAAQIQFAADEGFTAMFDNGLMNRPAADQENRELRARLMECIEVLTPREREIFLLRDVEGLNIEETRRIAGGSAVSVRVHLSAARRKIRDRIKIRYPEMLGRSS